MSLFTKFASILGVSSFTAFLYSQSLNQPSDDDFLPMPNGKLYHKSCIHIHDDHFTVESVDEGSIINGEFYEPCKYEPRDQVVDNS